MRPISHGMLGRFIIAATVSSLATAASGQAPSTRVSGDAVVSSVKENISGSDRATYNAVPGTIFISNARLSDIIANAYGVDLALKQYKLQGGPSTLLERRFDVMAKSSDDNVPTNAKRMLQDVLAERFQLRVHSERRPTPVYAIRVARPGQLGPELRPSTYSCVEVLKSLIATGKAIASVEPPHDSKNRPICWGTRRPAQADSGPLGERLIFNLQAFVDRPLIDETGLEGNYEWHLEFSRSDRGQTDLPSIYTAFQEQLGLKLQPTTASTDVLVIDSVEAPEPN